MPGHYRKTTIDSALLYLLKAIDAIKEVKDIEKPKKSEIDKIQICISNAAKRVQEASTQHDSNKGNWKSPDMNVSKNLKDLNSQLVEWRNALQKMSDAKARKK